MFLRVALLLVAVAGAGCAARPKPPVFNLHERQRLVVLPFRNSTPDASLGPAIEGEILAQLGRLGAVPVASPAPVRALLQRLAAGEAAEEADVRGRVAAEFECDLIMVGWIRSYSETRKKNKPRRIRMSYRQDAYKWGYDEEARVRIEVTMQVLDAKTGAVVWKKDLPGGGESSRWMDLSWPGEETAPPPEEKGEEEAETAPPQPVSGQPGKPGKGESVPAPRPVAEIVDQIRQGPAAGDGKRELLHESDSNVRRAREDAISYVVHNTIRDFRGRGGWHPGLKKGKK